MIKCLQAGKLLSKTGQKTKNSGCLDLMSQIRNSKNDNIDDKVIDSRLTGSCKRQTFLRMLHSMFVTENLPYISHCFYFI